MQPTVQCEARIAEIRHVPLEGGDLVEARSRKKTMLLCRGSIRVKACVPSPS